MDFTPISSLGPSLSSPATKQIRAIVTIIWPYSSSTKSAALLLVEPDFRLRNRKGQVRIQLRGASAQAVAQSGITSGDEVILGLQGARWVEATAGISTPGKSVETELVFGRKITIQITRNGTEIASLHVDDQSISQSTSPALQPSTPIEPSYTSASPALTRVNGMATPAKSAFHRWARVSSGSLVDSPYDPFVGERRDDGEPLRKRVRRSWGSEGRWKLADEQPSPEKDKSKNRWLEDEEDRSPEPSPVGKIQAPSIKELSAFVSPIRHGATTSQIEEMRSQYTQELVNMVGGDTEEDTDMEVPDSPTPLEPSTQDHKEGALQQVGFAVFRDKSQSQSGVGQGRSTGKPKSETIASELDQTPSSIRHGHYLRSREHRDDAVTHENQLFQSIPPLPAETLGNSLIDSNLIEARPSQLGMLPPTLPSIQTSGFGFGFGQPQPQPLAPPSALPGSPRTPDLQPQQSAALPLPSPFPGEALATSYMDASIPSPHLPRAVFGESRPVTPSLVPDHLFQFGFGFGSGGLLPFERRSDAESSSQNIVAPGPQKSMDEDVNEKAHMSSPVQREGLVSYPQLDLPEAFELEFPNEPNNAPHFGEGETIRPPSEGSQSLYPNLPPSTLDEKTHLPQQDDPAVLSAYAEFLEDQKDREPASEVLDEAESRIAPTEPQVVFDDDDDDLYAEPSVKSASPDRMTAEVPAVPNAAMSPHSTAPVVIDLISDSESEASAEEGSDIEIMDVDGNVSEDALAEGENGDLNSISEGEQHESQKEPEIDEDDEQASHTPSESGSEEAEEYSSDQEDPGFQHELLNDERQSPEPSQSLTGLDGAFDSSTEVQTMARTETVKVLLSSVKSPSPMPISSPLIASSPTKPSPSTATRGKPIVIDLGSDSVNSDEAPIVDVKAQAEVASQKDKEPSEKDVETQDDAPPIQVKPEPVVAPRSAVTFAPRVTRARAALIANNEYSTQLEPRSSAPLANSQDFRPPKMVVQDTFEGMIHSDGSITTAPPSNDDVDSDDTQSDSRPTPRTLRMQTRARKSQTPMLANIPEDRVHEMPAQPLYSPITSPLPTDDLPFMSSSPPEDHLEEQSERDIGSQLNDQFDQAHDDITHQRQEGYENPSLHPTLPSISNDEGWSHPTTLPPDSNLLMTPDASQQLSQPTFQAAQQESVLPPTQQMTQGTVHLSVPGVIPEVGQNEETAEMKEVEATDIRESSRRTSKRKSDVPSVISPWFAPRRASQRLASSSPPADSAYTEGSQTLRNDSQYPTTQNGRQNTHDTALISTNAEESLLRRMKGELLATSQPTAQPRSSPRRAKSSKAERDLPDSHLPSTYSLSQSQQSQAKGLLTALSYYTPLANLHTHLNIAPSQSFNDTGVDILAVVTKPSTIPQRAEKGRRDYHTAFSVTDESFWPISVRVQIFRPWKNALPKAVKGDFVLLRGFEVFSAKGNAGVGLKAGDSGAWCVWRFHGITDDDGEKDQPAWGTRNSEGKSLVEREEVKGPPIEVGKEEREFVGGLRKWWGEKMIEANSESSQAERAML